MQAEVVWSKRLWIFIDVAFNVIKSQCQAQNFNSDVHPWLQFQYFQFKQIVIQKLLYYFFQVFRILNRRTFLAFNSDLERSLAFTVYHGTAKWPMIPLLYN